MELKTCITCGDSKVLALFPKRGNKCKQCKSEYDAEWRRLNKDRYKAQKAEYYQRNKEARSAYDTQYREQNKELRAVTNAAWYQANKAEQAAYKAAYREQNAEAIRERNQRRRAIKRSAFVEQVEISVLRERDGDDCYLCGDPLDFDTPRAVHIEHKTPLSRGGEHSYANTTLACAGCNQEKGAKTVEEFLLFKETVNVPSLCQ